VDRRAARARGPSIEGSAPDGEGEALRRHIQRFIRQFGVLASDRTPCGKPLAVSHAHALMVLLEHRRAGRRPTQQDLGRVLGIDKSNVARLCSKMEAAGQLLQERGDRDARLRLLTLTPGGIRLALSVERASQERFERLLRSVRPGERASVLSALATLNEALATAAPPRAVRPVRAPRPRGGPR
jgi:DNA-binding MarR family transcriptional regulator